MWSIARSLLGKEDEEVIIKVDPSWGFAEFPPPGDSKKHLLPILIDPEEVQTNNTDTIVVEEKVVGRGNKEFWMPDRYCKVCYGCEEPFTMYRRRHHCRMCGQIFCNNCSSYSIDGTLFSTPGLVRACKECFEQTAINDMKASRRKQLSEKVQHVEAQSQAQHIRDLNTEYRDHNENLQARASSHLTSIIEKLVDGNILIADRGIVWKEIILNLIKMVVSTVDPDVRNGDSLDIRPYVKIKVIPGGTTSECTYIDGVVFRKNVSHKKMSSDGTKTNPKILLLAGGIEFQRAEIKLSSMDTLIEQEDKYMEILVEKIMSLKPDIILVGKAVARRAQELLCEHNVVVMQNVKLTVLERVARMTRAMLLPSTDNMIQQFGEECLGTCGSFFMRLVQDDPEKSGNTAPQRILRTRISRASTYAYFQGCPTEKGCSIVLRGAERCELAEVKKVIRFAISVAYHLRLEVAYYNDRFADIPVAIDYEAFDDGSDMDDLYVNENSPLDISTDANPVVLQLIEQNKEIKVRRQRNLLSTSLDIDFNVPYRRELVGTSLFRSKNLTKFHIEGHQTLLITSILMGEGNQQKTGADVKGIKYYTKHDIALGHFIMENCFQFSRGMNKESKMLDQTLSFVHRPGRIDITVRKVERAHHHGDDNNNIAVNTTVHAPLQRDASRLILSVSSYCKACGRVVTPPHVLSEEVYKLSFGKFLEMMFYNRSAICTVGGCCHSLRDEHILSFLCENYVASFEFSPIQAYALHVRTYMPFPEEFYWLHTMSILSKLPERHAVLVEDFKLSMIVLEREVRDLLSNRPEDMALAMADVQMMEVELQASSVAFLEDLLRTYENLPKRYLDKDMEAKIKTLMDGYSKYFFKSDRPLPSIAEGDEVRGSNMDRSESFFDSSTHQSSADQSSPFFTTQDIVRTEFSPQIGALFPMAHYRDTYLRACRWNTRIDTIYKFLESVRNMLLQQMNVAAMHAMNNSNANVPPSSVTHLMSSVYNQPEYEEADQDYLLQKKNLTEGLMADLERNPNNAEIVQQTLAISVLGTASSEKHNFLNLKEDSTDTSTVVTSQSTDPSFSVNSDPSVPSTAITSFNTFYKTSMEQSKKAGDKPVDKMSRITKALGRFLVLGNKDANADENHKFFVPLGEFGNGRYGLKPGRNGVVIPVHEEVFASIIAYALASNEYFRDLHASIREIAPDLQEATVGNDQEGLYPDGQTSNHRSDQDKLADESDRIEKKIQDDDDNDDEDKEENDDENSRQTNNRHISVATNKPTNYGLTTLMKNFNSNNDQDDENSQKIDSDNSSMFASNSGGKKDNALFGNNNKPSNLPSPDHQNISQVDSGISSTGDFSNNPDLNANSKIDLAVGEGLSDKENPTDDVDVLVNDIDDNDGMSMNEKQMMSQDKSNIRIRFNDYDDRGNLICKFQCQIYYAKQFEAVRTCYFNEEDSRDNYIRSLAMTARWVAQGGKSGASFAKTMDERLVIKAISKVELQMYLDFAPAYFEYMAKAYYHNLPTVLCKILGVYTVRYDNKETGKKSSDNVVVMENIFYQRNITKTFDLKGSSRARYAEIQGQKFDMFDEAVNKRRKARRKLQSKRAKLPVLKRINTDGNDADVEDDVENTKNFAHRTLGGDALDGNLLAALNPVTSFSQVLLDDNLMEFTKGRPFPLKHRAKMFFHKAVQNDTLFLSIVNVVDYSILVGIDENSHELVVGIIDYLRQYDIIKRVERLGKGSVGMLTGQADPTIIQPSQYRKRFTLAMDRYFMTVPDKWINYDA